MTRSFRFGVVAPLRTDLATWRDRVRRIADAGYSTLLMPDVPQWQPAPGPTLALAAALANIRVGTWVYASPVRPPWITAWEAHSLFDVNRFGSGTLSVLRTAAAPGASYPELHVGSLFVVQRNELGTLTGAPGG